MIALWPFRFPDILGEDWTCLAWPYQDEYHFFSQSFTVFRATPNVLGSSSHATSLLICFYDFFTTLFRVPIRCRIFTTLPLTWFAAISLLSIWCMTITRLYLYCYSVGSKEWLLSWWGLLFGGDDGFILPQPPLGMTHYRDLCDSRRQRENQPCLT